jgi:hypothetical protein
VAGFAKGASECAVGEGRVEGVGVIVKGEDEMAVSEGATGGDELA